MAKVITAPESIDVPGFKAYLGGAIDMGFAQDWQAKVIRALADYENLVLLNPRRVYFNESTLDEQIYWELAAMEAADLLLIWFPYNAKAPVALLETGLYLRSNKLLLGAEEGFYRRRNLEITAERYSVKLWAHLDDLIREMVTVYSRSRDA